MCLAALKTLTDKSDRLSLASTTWLVATGASGILLVCTSMFMIFLKIIDQGAITQACNIQSGLHGNMLLTFGCCCVFNGGEGNDKAMCNA
jgi:hypothetical protein